MFSVTRVVGRRDIDVGWLAPGVVVPTRLILVLVSARQQWLGTCSRDICGLFLLVVGAAVVPVDDVVLSVQLCTAHCYFVSEAIVVLQW